MFLNRKIINFFSWYLVPGALLVLGGLLTVKYYQGTHLGFFTLDSYHKYEGEGANQEIHAGQLLEGGVKSELPNFGILAIKFNTFDRVNSDVLKFRIREQNAPDWYYENNYSTDQFQLGEHFPFGFPPIANSQDKIYLFQIESINGIHGNAVAVDSTYPSLVATYQFTRDQAKAMGENFVKQKGLNLLRDENLIRHLLLYFLPVIFYLVILSRGYHWAPLFFLLATGIDVVWAAEKKYLVFLMTGLWLINLIRNQINSRVSVIMAIIILVINPLTKVYTTTQIEKLGLWVYSLLIITILQQLFEIVFKQDVQVTAKQLWDALLFLAFGGSAKDRLQSIKSPLALQILKVMRKPARFVYICLGYGWFVWLVWKLVDQTIGQIAFYITFFPVNQIQLFFNQVGIYLIFFYLVMGIIILLVKFKLRKNILIAVALMYLTIRSGDILFGKMVAAHQLNDKIYIWGISPTRATLWDEVKVEGRNFKELPWQNKVTVAGVEHRVIKWTDKEIIFQAEPGKTKSGEVVVIDKDGRVSNAVKIEYYDYFTKETID